MDVQNYRPWENISIIAYTHIPE